MAFNTVLHMLHYNVVFQGKQILWVVKDSDCSKQSKQTLCLHTCAASAQRCLLSPAAVRPDRHSFDKRQEDTCLQDTGPKTACLDCSLRYMQIAFFDIEESFLTVHCRYVQRPRDTIPKHCHVQRYRGEKSEKYGHTFNSISPHRKKARTCLKALYSCQVSERRMCS